MNPECNSNAVKVMYADEVNECQLHIVFAIQCIEAQALLAKKLRKNSKKQIQAFHFMRNANLLLETEINLDKQKKKSLIVSLEAIKSRNIELKKEILLIKNKRQNMIKTNKNRLQKYEEHWIACKKRFESIAFIEKYLHLTNKIENIKGNNVILSNETAKIYSNINIKQKELLDFDRKLVIDLADFVINKRLAILKHIKEKTNEIKMLENKKENKILRDYQTRTCEIPTSIPTKVIMKVKDAISDDTSEVTNKDNSTMVFPKLQLYNINVGPEFNQIQEVNLKKAVSIKRSLGVEGTMELDNIMLNKIKAQKVNDGHVSSYFTPLTLESNKDLTHQTKKYSEMKLIHILEDKKLDSAGAYKIISKLKPYQLQDVNVIKADVIPNDSKENKLSQEKVNMKTTEETDVTESLSQYVLVPPSQFLDFSQNSQEKKVTFNTLITNQNPKSQDTLTDNCTLNPQLNVSTDSVDTYKTIKDFVFKKHNLNIISPEFTYTKNPVQPKKREKNNVTSIYFDEKNKNKVDYKDNIEKKGATIVVNDNNKPENDVIEVDLKLRNRNNTTTDDLFEDKKQNDDAIGTGPVYRNFLQTIPDSLNISMNTTGFEDTDADFPQCFDSSLLLSPKADDEIKTNDNKIQGLSQEVPNFLSGLRKTRFSIFGTAASEDKPASEAQNPSNHFTFSGDEKKKRGGFFNIFH